MSWAAANAPRSQRDRQSVEGEVFDDGGFNEGGREKRRSTETVEAVLSRLSKAYTTSMDCIGALNKTNLMLEKDPSKITEETLAVMNRVSIAARSTLENGILLDPLVLPHMPTLHETMCEFLERDDVACSQRWQSVQERRPIPPVLSSAAHRSTIVELAYLALVNYSDLLQSCCACAIHESSVRESTSLLDQGVATKIKTLQDRNHCCWMDEPQEDTQRLAVTALCDASKLDGSDPTVWLKLACASRGLENILQVRGLSTISRTKHRRLQRYALEQGSLALPRHMPPNRTIQRALEDLRAEPEPIEYQSPHENYDEPIKIVLDLPRYSWSVLGRMLLRASRDGADFPVDHRHQSNVSTRPRKSIQFGSPIIEMSLSPMLILPTRVMGRICLFLNNGAIWRFEATCRALSVAIMSARAVMEEEKVTGKDFMTQEIISDFLEQSQGAEAGASMEPHGMETEKKGENQKGKDFHRVSKENHRSSQRLRSQQITSGKKAERSGKRQSFEYCFLAATSGTTLDEHKAAIKDARSADDLFQNELSGLDSHHLFPRRSHIRRNEYSEALHSKRREAQEPIGHSSLAAFVNQWSNRNSGPMDLMMKYLVHIAMNVEEVFAGDPGGTVVLASCILSCFEAQLKRSGFQDQLVPRFYMSPSTKCCFRESLEGFALDVLHGELILKQCDRYSPIHVTYDDDCNMITIMVPNLYEACSELESVMGERDDKVDEPTKKTFAMLRIRCNWLLAGFYLWRSRIASSIWEGKEAEEEGTACIEEALKGFSSPDLQHMQSLPTTHLASPGRTESYWKELSPSALAKYRDEIQASAVVSLVRGKFQDLITALDCRTESSEINLEVSDDDAKALQEIGETLFDRYKSGYGDPEAKHSELVENFLSVNGNDIVRSSQGDENDADSLSLLIPLGRVDVASLRKMSSPSILSMLVVCMNMESTNQYIIIELLVRLLLSTKDTHKVLLQRINDAKATRKGEDDDDFSDSDDESMMSDDSHDRNSSNKNMDGKRAIQCGHLVAFILQRVTETFSEHLSIQEKQRFIADEGCQTLMRCSLELSSKWFETTAKHFAPEDSADLSILRSISSLVVSLREVPPESERQKIDGQYFQCMTKILVSHRKVFTGLVRNHGDRSTRASKQKLCAKRAEYMKTVASEIGILLSEYVGKVQNLVMVPSAILAGFPNNEWNIFVDSILWLWTYASQSLSETTPGTGPPEAVCNSFDRPIVKSLRIPIATIVVGLCGSAAFSRTARREPAVQSDDPLDLAEFYDSDDSANELLLDDDSPDDEDKNKRKELLRVVCHAVHCISLVLDRIDDREALSVASQRRCTDIGPNLPLVALRVLNCFADSLLQNFVAENQHEANLWSTKYPVSARTLGEILDCNLHKTYRWLYGFVLVGEKAHLQSSGKDLATASAPIAESVVKDCQLESVSAAAQLYRCVVRAYSVGRRSPPKRALELVSCALPLLEENEKSKALKSFLFNATESYLSLDQIASLVSKDVNWDKPFDPIKVHLVPGDANSPSCPSEETEETMRVRRGILSQLASGQLPTSTNEVGKGKLDQAQDDDRVATIKSEEEISKKFEAILGDLCLGDAVNSQGWYRAAQCLNSKAEIIADRLGLSKGFARNTDFAIPIPELRSMKGIDREKLEHEQDEEDSLINANWIHYLGDDLSLYARFSWASFDSLRRCSGEIGKSCSSKPSQSLVLKGIDSQYKKGNYLTWQEAWGGIFVFALRKLSVRFMSVALYLLQSKAEQAADDKVLISELCESLGIMLYSDLMGSQNYGYPMRSMGLKRKRDLASVSKTCFRAAADTVLEPTSTDDGSSETQATWDLLFMIGKCDEKIAGTYKLETFSTQVDEKTEPRLYEKFMASALIQYAEAYSQAKGIEEEGGFIVEQSGGSAHGRTEILYRILATRLKCLISAATWDTEEFDRAEEEALRLTELNWFKPPEDSDALKKEHVRDRVWNVLEDVVSGLAQCRADQPFFHRSVYRHAQALMWSPILYDLACSEGSLDSVPATRSFQIRGLNSSTPVSHSAEVVLSSLFDKKRAQLCAVWVTTTATSSSPFQLLNNSVRKYDSLRGKYISAYLQTLRLSRRRGKLEAFLKWAMMCRRDLPGYFQTSARAGGGVLAKTHANDLLLLIHNSLTERSFLTTVKRETNSSFADVLLHEMSERSMRESPVDDQKMAVNFLKFSYACYLRLNCSREDLDKIRAWKYGGDSIREVEAVCQAYLALGDESEGTAGKAEIGDWSGRGRKAVIFDRALTKCKELFPALSGTFFSKMAGASTKPKKGSGKETDQGGKRKEPDSNEETTAMSYEVTVPPGMSAGESFYTTVKVGGITKKLKLTVPETNPSSLRFTLQVPKETVSAEQAAKKARTEPDDPESSS